MKQGILCIVGCCLIVMVATSGCGKAKEDDKAAQQTVQERSDSKMKSDK